MGPKARYVGNEIPAEALIWQDPIAEPGYSRISNGTIRKAKRLVMASGLAVPELVRTAWASAGSYRHGDMRGGTNGARLALAPQKDWAVNNPVELDKVLNVLRGIRAEIGEQRISMADLIVLAGNAAIEKAAADAGVDVTVPFTAGRGDATQDETDVVSFGLLEPAADAFRNYYNASSAYRSPAEMLVDRADQLTLTVPEMTVLLGGMRVLAANSDGNLNGVFTDRPGTLTNDFFVNLMDMDMAWRKAEKEGLYEGLDRASGEVRYTGTPVDLIFGSNSELRAVAEVYAYDNAQERFVNDFANAWAKVMNLGLF